MLSHILNSSEQAARQDLEADTSSDGVERLGGAVSAYQVCRDMTPEQIVDLFYKSLNDPKPTVWQQQHTAELEWVVNCMSVLGMVEPGSVPSWLPTYRALVHVTRLKFSLEWEGEVPEGYYSAS